MAIARVVEFAGVSKDRIEEMRRMMSEEEQRDDIPAKEVLVLHDPESEKTLVVLFFESDDDYQRADETLSAMPTEDTPGQRTSVTKYDVAIRMAD